MATFFLIDCKNYFKVDKFRPLMIKINCASFTKSDNRMQILSHKQEMQIINLKWLLFPY